jgi:2-iminobutanoate/2-iminopropanoate deaminase
MNKYLVSKKIVPPTSFYSHSVEASGTSRVVFASGQIAVAPDGSCPFDFASQARQCWSNLAAVLEESGMTMQDVVKVQGFITRTEDLAEYRAIRNEAVGDTRPAHTLLVVAALGRPEWLVELEAIAAKD